MKELNKQRQKKWEKAGVTLMLALALNLCWVIPGFAQTLVSADFTGQSLPVGWSNIDNGSSGQIWQFNNPGNQNISGGIPGFDGDFAILDSDHYGYGSTQDASLQTDTFDVSGASGWVYLYFDEQYNPYTSPYDSSAAAIDVWNGSSWTNVFSLTDMSDGYPFSAAHKEIDITTACGGSSTVVVRFHYTGGYTNWWAIDNVVIKAISCFSPEHLAVTNINYDSATISWNLPINTTAGNGYQYYYNTSGTNPTAATIPSGVATDTFADLTGLSPNTTYFAWVRSLCSSTDTSDWSMSKITFLTTCLPDTAPRVDNVESQSGNGSAELVSPCWTAIPNQINQNLQYANFTAYVWNVSGNSDPVSNYTGPDSAYSGTKYFYTNSHYASLNDTAFLISPQVYIANLTNPVLQFYYYMYGSSMGHLYVQVSDNNGASWSTVDSLIGQQQLNNSDPWLKRTILLNGYSDLLSVRFVSNTVSYMDYGNMAIDDISIVEAPSCPPPLAASINIHNLVATSVSIDWDSPLTPPANGYQFYYSTSSTAPTATSNPTGSTLDTFVDLVGLTPNTLYYFWVRSVCSGSDTSDWSSSASFTTPCASETSFPWIEGFENMVSLGHTLFPACWYEQGFDWFTANTILFLPINVPHSGSNYLALDGLSATGYYNTNIIWTPPMHLTAGTSYEFSFYMQGDGVTYPHWNLSVFYNTAHDSVGATQLGSNFSPMGSSSPFYPYTFGTSPFEKKIFHFTPSTTGDYYFGIKSHADYYTAQLGFDDFSVSVAPSCFGPTAVTTDSITPYVAKVIWNAPAGSAGTGYDYFYNSTNTAPTFTSLPTGTLTDSFIVLSNLTPNTTYYFWLRSHCDDSTFSDWSANPLIFSTECLIDDVPYAAPIAAAAPGIPPYIPSCMSVDLLNPNGYNWHIDVGNPGSLYGMSGSYLLSHPTQHNNGAVNSWIFTNLINLNAGTHYKLSFKYGNNSSIHPEKLAVAYGKAQSADSMTTTLFDNTNILLAGSTDTNLYFTVAATGAYCFGFHAHSDEAQRNLFLSDIVLDSFVCNTPYVYLGNDTGFCDGATITLTTGNTDTNITILWNNGSVNDSILVNTTGNYVATVTDRFSCSSNDSIQINVIPYPVVNLGSDTAICDNDTLTLNAGSQPLGTTFNWNTTQTSQSIQVTDTGLYQVVTNNQGCITIDSVLVGRLLVPTVDSIAGTANGNGSFSFVAMGTQNVADYYWDFGDGSNASDSSVSHTYAQGGNFQVSLIVSNECGSDTVSTSVSFAGTGIHQIEVGKDQLKLYPNPARDQVIIKNESPYKMESVVVYNVLGQKVYHATTDGHHYQLNVQSYASGLYNVKITLTNGSWVFRKFEIKK